MTSTTDDEMTPERFAALLDIHGSDFERWPQASRETARALVAKGAAAEPVAVGLLREAQALDRLLALAPTTPATHDRLDRIVAARSLPTGAAPVEASSDGKIVDLAAARQREALHRAAGRPEAPRTWRLPLWQRSAAGGALAASLLLGVWLGASGAASPSLTPSALAQVFQPRKTAAVEAIGEIYHAALPPELHEDTDEDTL